MSREASVDAPSDDRSAPLIGVQDLHLFAEGRHRRLYDWLGAHVAIIDGVGGTAFSVWAPGASGVRLVGDCNGWDGRNDPLAALGSSGVWFCFVPGAGAGTRYKFEVHPAHGPPMLKADPMAYAAECPPGTASIVHQSRHTWTDDEWMTRRAALEPQISPLSIYEVHLGSWRRSGEDQQPLDYLALAEQLSAYVVDLGFTHVELMPVMTHPFSGSWGYQVTSYYAPTPQLGDPDDFKAFVDVLHGHGIGVILDWVPAHFPRDEWALAAFDGTALYEHADPRRGAHPDWGTLIFDYGRPEVRNFLVANALFWVREYHADGIRADAVASMLYLDYSRQADEWVPNVHGGRENLEAVALVKELNDVLHAEVPGVVSVAEESTAWPSVSRPTDRGGLGFGFKWNLGWMHDTLGYFSQEPVDRGDYHDQLTFSLVYAFTENFVLPLSHDEVVHGKGSLINKMAGDRWERFANLRALLAHQWAHPGKKLLFMGGEIAQEREWSHDRSLDWFLMDQADHAGIHALVRDLNKLYRRHPALWQLDGEDAGFSWLDAEDADRNVIAYLRRATDPSDVLVCVVNLSPVTRHGYRLGLPSAGRWTQVLNTASSLYGGSGVDDLGAADAEPIAFHGQPCSAQVTLPPLAAVWLVPE